MIMCICRRTPNDFATVPTPEGGRKYKLTRFALRKECRQAEIYQDAGLLGSCKRESSSIRR